MNVVRNHIKVHNSDFIFLSETNSSKLYGERLRFSLGFGGCFAVDRVGMSGGLVLYWKEDKEVQIRSFSRFHIEARCMETNGKGWRFMGIYENSNPSQRRFTWELLRKVHGLAQGPWLCGGDFNEIIYNFEK